MALVLIALAAPAGVARAQSSAAAVAGTPDLVMPVMDNQIYAHLLFDQLEGRTNGPDTELRWDGEGWLGTDFNRLWIKSEGFYTDRNKVEDGDHELLYDRPITTYFDAQGGLRYDLDSGPQRFWGAFGIEGLAPEFFNFQATAYARDAGHFAARVMGSYDWRLTQLLVAQPECELNFYSKKDPARAIGSGLSEIDTGLRIRYELSRKFAPYVGVAYNQKFGQTADFARQEGEIVRDLRFVFGIRVWR
ncbi:MAG TPA: copper resistance protein B [Candidatus Binataceae bacterium]|nr:copper resistance protein B [Candidatus Binataceae bacterium]